MNKAITGDVLIKLGFEKVPNLHSTDNYTMYQKETGRHGMIVSVDNKTNDYIILFNHDFCGFNQIADVNTIEYDHQLENLFCLLTGTEDEKNK